MFQRTIKNVTWQCVPLEDYGDNLQEYLRSNELTLIERIQIILSLLNELNRLETIGIIHQNLKSQNICVKKVKRKIIRNQRTKEEIQGQQNSKRKSKQDHQELKDNNEQEEEFFKLHIIGFEKASTDDKRAKNTKSGAFEWIAPDEYITHALDKYMLAPLIAEILGADSKVLFHARSGEARKTYIC